MRYAEIKKDTTGLIEIATTGHPRSGNTWLNRLLSDILDSPLQTNPGEKVSYFGSRQCNGKYVIRKRHVRNDGVGATPPDCPIAFIYRDPRDVAVSTLFYRKAVLDTWAVVRQLVGHYDDWIRSWWDTGDADAMLSYEELQFSPVPTLKRVVSALTDETYSDQHIMAAYNRQNFDNITRKYPEFHGSMYKGKTGEWERFLSREMGEFLEENIGELMFEQGYTIRPDWWKALPVEPLCTKLEKGSYKSRCR